MKLKGIKSCITRKFNLEVQNFYQTCFQNVEEWFQVPQRITDFNGVCFLTSSQVNWIDIESCAAIVLEELLEIKINDFVVLPWN